MADPLPPDVPTWLTAAAAAATAIGAVIATLAARSASRQAAAAEAALKEARTQSSLARAELQEARRQGEIALHSHRLAAYQAFLELYYEVNAHASSFNSAALWAFAKQAGLAEFYFPDPIATSMNRIVDKALRLRMNADRAADKEAYPLEELKRLRELCHREFLELVETMDTVRADLRAVLKLVPDA